MTTENIAHIRKRGELMKIEQYKAKNGQQQCTSDIVTLWCRRTEE
jgi:hypothetical protein